MSTTTVSAKPLRGPHQKLPCPIEATTEARMPHRSMAAETAVRVKATAPMALRVQPRRGIHRAHNSCARNTDNTHVHNNHLRNTDNPS